MYKGFYTFLCSADCKDYFPHNNASSFYAKPPNPFSFIDGQWEVALCELKILGVDDKSDGSGRFLLCCDLVQQSVVGGDQFPVLYEISLKKGENRIVTFLDCSQLVTSYKAYIVLFYDVTTSEESFQLVKSLSSW